MTYVYFISAVGSDPEYAIKREALSTISRKFKFEIFFPLEQRKSFFVGSALSDMRAASLIVADLSFERPSCYFEMGLAGALKTPLVLIAAQGTHIHQTVESSVIHQYENNDDYIAVVTRVITEKLKQCHATTA